MNVTEKGGVSCACVRAAEKEAPVWSLALGVLFLFVCFVVFGIKSMVLHGREALYH